MKIHQTMMALALSLALCAAPVMAQAGHMGKRHVWGGHMQGCAISGPHAKLVCHAMKKSYAENKPLMEKAMKLHRKTQAVLSAKTFDAKTYLALTREMSALHGKMMDNRARAIASVASKLSPDERARAFAFPPMHGMHGKGGCKMMNANRDAQKDWFSHLNK